MLDIANRKEKEVMPLTIAPIETDLTILKLTLTDEKLLKHLESLGFVSEASIKILARNKSGHIIQIQEGRLALDFDVSNHILVKW